MNNIWSAKRFISDEIGAFDIGIKHSGGKGILFRPSLSSIAGDKHRVSHLQHQAW